MMGSKMWGEVGINDVVINAVVVVVVVVVVVRMMYMHWGGRSEQGGGLG